MKQIFLFAVAATYAGVGADEYTHRYKSGDKVDLWVNKVSRSRGQSRPGCALGAGRPVALPLLWGEGGVRTASDPVGLGLKKMIR